MENTDVSLIKGGILKTNTGSQELRLLQRNFQSEVSLRPEFISIDDSYIVFIDWGLLLNLMPCVFPVISLKILNFVNHSENRSQTSLHGMFFSLGYSDVCIDWVIRPRPQIHWNGRWMGISIAISNSCKSFDFFVYISGWFFLLNVNFLIVC